MIASAVDELGRSAGGFAGWAAALAVLGCLTVALARFARLDLGWLPIWALVRAVVQLAVIAALLHGILSVPWTVLAFLALMLTTASYTSAGRIALAWHGRRAAAIGVIAGSVVSVGLVLLLRLVDVEARYVVAVAGILVGNSMTGATLTGRNFLHAAQTRRDEIEGWFAIGATPAQAHDEIGRYAVRESLLPTLDQTRATGLVTLPGAFVGALFGGASPVVAAQFQLVVLAGIALTMTITGLVVVRVIGRSPYLPTGDPA